jgi:hypothetical protein
VFKFRVVDRKGSGAAKCFIYDRFSRNALIRVIHAFPLQEFEAGHFADKLKIAFEHLELTPNQIDEIWTLNTFPGSHFTSH